MKLATVLFGSALLSGCASRLPPPEGVVESSANVDPRAVIGTWQGDLYDLGDAFTSRERLMGTATLRLDPSLDGELAVDFNPLLAYTRANPEGVLGSWSIAGNFLFIREVAPPNGFAAFRIEGVTTDSMQLRFYERIASQVVNDALPFVYADQFLLRLHRDVDAGTSSSSAEESQLGNQATAAELRPSWYFGRWVQSRVLETPPENYGQIQDYVLNDRPAELTLGPDGLGGLFVGAHNGMSASVLSPRMSGAIQTAPNGAMPSVQTSPRVPMPPANRTGGPPSQESRSTPPRWSGPWRKLGDFIVLEDTGGAFFAAQVVSFAGNSMILRLPSGLSAEYRRQADE